MGIGKKALSLSFDDALTKVPAALKTDRFGVRTEIDVCRRRLAEGSAESSP